MSKYYTRKGDDGMTGILGEGRLPKFDVRIEALGAVDEASAALGFARSLMKSQEFTSLVIQLQRDLYTLMAEIASTPETEARFRMVDEDKVKWIEARIDEVGLHINVPNEFIVPGDNPSAAAFSLARTVIRRAERRVVELYHSGHFRNEWGLAYLNRLSSLCFLLEINELRYGDNLAPTLAKGI